jgi:hypothetical protein
MTKSKRSFPQSMKVLREKFPKTLLVQLRIISPNGTVIEYEGADDPRLLSELLQSLRETGTGQKKTMS